MARRQRLAAFPSPSSPPRPRARCCRRWVGGVDELWEGWLPKGCGWTGGRSGPLRLRDSPTNPRRRSMFFHSHTQPNPNPRHHPQQQAAMKRSASGSSHGGTSHKKQQQSLPSSSSTASFSASSLLDATPRKWVQKSARVGHFTIPVWTPSSSTPTPAVQAAPRVTHGSKRRRPQGGAGGGGGGGGWGEGGEGGEGDLLLGPMTRKTRQQLNLEPNEGLPDEVVRSRRGGGGGGGLRRRLLIDPPTHPLLTPLLHPPTHPPT